MSMMPALADDLLAACVSVVEVEGQPEGVAGCECLVKAVGNDEPLTNELLKLAALPAEERMLSSAASEAVRQCFAVPEEDEPIE